MKTTKEQADELVESHLQALIDNSNHFANRSDALMCAILSVKHTIEVLEKIKYQLDYDNYYFIINEQTDLLKELESRL